MAERDRIKRSSIQSYGSISFHLTKPTAFMILMMFFCEV
jgi:hypothetical protein